MDQVANFIKETVSGTHDASTTTINVVDASAFPDPASGEYNLTWYDATNYPDPSDDPNKEIVRVTAYDIVLDTLTVTRGQESITATTKSTGGATYKLILAPTAKTMNDLDDWRKYTTVIPTVTTSDINGIDTITFTGEDLTNSYQLGDWVKDTSTGGTDLIHKIVDIFLSGSDTIISLVGEASVSGTITAISFSKLASPQGAIPWENIFKAYLHRDGSNLALTEAIKTKIAMNSVGTPGYDPNSDNNSSEGNYVFPVSGYFEITTKLDISTSLATDHRGIVYFDVNSINISRNTILNGSSTGSPSFQAIYRAYFNRGDKINIAFYFSGVGSGITLNGASSFSHYTIQFISI